MSPDLVVTEKTITIKMLEHCNLPKVVLKGDVHFSAEVTETFV